MDADGTATAGRAKAPRGQGAKHCNRQWRTTDYTKLLMAVAQHDWLYVRLGTGVAAPGGLVPDARLDIAGLANVLKLRAEIERQWKGIPPPPERYYDLSYHDAALARLAGRSR